MATHLFKDNALNPDRCAVPGCGGTREAWYHQVGEPLEHLSEGAVVEYVAALREENKRCRKLLQSFVDSGVEFDEHRNYVVMQIDRDDLEAAQLLLAEKG